MTKQGNEGVLISREVQWFVDTLRKDYGIRVTAQEVGYEGLELGMDEVDEVFIPKELFEVIPTTMLYELMILDESKGNVWSGTIGFYPNSPEWCLQVIMKNDELQLRKLLSLLD
ncbi:hypothetical protein [Sporosarcina sp. P1]|uniref:hypothetical protein n=1 Tax=Sporosarcina sp. P1 TaxID=2048257 RepID=UPI000C16E9F5|nr:hypothetical protein [Sporosarcina sp. P1]PIC83065.1 hypothetical protein CSV73_08745 [Sporosarcina sp. P1]